MDKRVLFASVISMGVVLVWITFFGKKPDEKKPEPPPAASVAGAPATANPTTAQAANEPKKQPDAPKAADTVEGPPAPQAPKATPVETVVEDPKHYKATFTSDGAALSSWVLLDPQYKEDNPKLSNKKSDQIDLVRTRAPNLPFTITFPSSTFKLPPDAVWTLEPRGSDGALVYVWEDETTRVEKRFELQPHSYTFKVVVTVENKSNADKYHYFQVQMHGWQDPTVKPGGFMSRPVSLTSGACYVNGKVHRKTYEELTKEKDNAKGWIEEAGDVRWAGVGEQYFFDAVGLAVPEQTRCNVFAAPDGSISSIITVGARTVKAHGKTSYEMVAFMGPKILSQLDDVKIGGQSARFGDVMEYRLWGLTEWLARPMLAILKAVHFVVPSWGFAIILLTVLIKIATWYPTQKSMKSMKAMATLKPEMDKLKERFGDDKNKLNMATMELYKKHGVNPLGGCLPLLLQMPVYFALYSMLGNSVELYRSPFLWVHDLTAPDPFYVLPVLTGALMFLQQKTQPTPADPNQKTMMYAMPVMFTVFNLVWPAGLTIYILTNTVLTFLQQWLMNRGDKKPTPPKAVAKPARA
jgi:YidC/Oxa1 family membrane protein insertase